MSAGAAWSVVQVNNCYQSSNHTCPLHFHKNALKYLHVETYKYSQIFIEKWACPSLHHCFSCEFPTDQMFLQFDQPTWNRKKISVNKAVCKYHGLVAFWMESTWYLWWECLVQSTYLTYTIFREPSHERQFSYNLTVQLCTKSDKCCIAIMSNCSKERVCLLLGWWRALGHAGLHAPDAGRLDWGTPPAEAAISSSIDYRAAQGARPCRWDEAGFAAQCPIACRVPASEESEVETN
jgi:hypothetical protein